MNNLMKAFVSSSQRPTVAAKADVVDVIRISDRNAIPISDYYVLVMEGVSTYVFEHERGVSFVVNNSIYNLDHARQLRDAVAAASAKARAKGLSAIYVLE